MKIAFLHGVGRIAFYVLAVALVSSVLFALPWLQQENTPLATLTGLPGASSWYDESGQRWMIEVTIPVEKLRECDDVRESATLYREHPDGSRIFRGQFKRQGESRYPPGPVTVQMAFESPIEMIQTRTYSLEIVGECFECEPAREDESAADVPRRCWLVAPPFEVTSPTFTPRPGGIGSTEGSIDR
jgi:hypothetical protein